MTKEINHSEKTTRKFKYDVNNHLIERTFYDSLSEMTILDSIKCNEEGKEIECKRYLKKDLFKKVFYSYDKNGNRIITKEFDKNGKSLRHDVLLYNDHADLIESIEYYPNGSILRKYIYKYNKEGYLTDWIWTDSSGKEVLSYKYTLDAFGNRAGWIIIKEGKYKDREDNYTYEYDKNGNWIKQIVYKDKKPSKVNLRQITYAK